MGKYTLLKQNEGHARRGELVTPHGTVQTPVFMNVGTQGAIKGALSARDLKEIDCQVELSNTYHLHVRPGDTLIKELGGLPSIKIHCSILSEQSIKAAVYDYAQKNGLEFEALKGFDPNAEIEDEDPDEEEETA